MSQDSFVHLYAVNALRSKRPGDVVEQILGLHDDKPLKRLVRIELKLTGVRGESHGVVIADDTKRHEVYQLRYYRIHLARHDGRSRLQLGKIDFVESSSRSRVEQDQVACD